MARCSYSLSAECHTFRYFLHTKYDSRPQNRASFTVAGTYNNYMALKTLVGMKFNRLTVLERLENRTYANSKSPQRSWRCLCDCGKECVKTTHQLRYSKSCGCLQKEVVKHRVQKVFPGERYGYLTTIEFKRDSSGTSGWLCKCFCGRETLVRTHRLRKGHQRSCGCMASAMRNETYYLNHPFVLKESRINELYYTYKAGARKRKHSFNLTKEQFLSLITQKCNYCDYGTDENNLRFNGIDRVDNSIGYELGNCVPCCSDCNYSKRDKTLQEWNSWIDRLVEKKRAVGTQPPLK